MKTNDLLLNIDKQHVLDFRTHIIEYDTNIFDFDSALRSEIFHRYGKSNIHDLSKIHQYFSENEIKSFRNGSPHWLFHISGLDKKFQNLYFRYVKFIAQHFKCDLLFEKNPILRFHVPGEMGERYKLNTGELMAYHSDTMLGDYFQQINVWLPLCEVYGSNALSVTDSDTSREILKSYIKENEFSFKEYSESRYKFFEYISERPTVIEKLRKNSTPISLSYGQCLVFDPRILHGTLENISDSTRISIDFRVLPVKDYDEIVYQLNKKGIDFTSYEGAKVKRGEYFHQLSSSELLT